MRDYKFRGKTKKGEWVYGSLLLINDKAYIREGQYCDLDDIDFGWGFEEVMPETIGQFTGLFDKNGIEIYEGDILFEDDQSIRAQMKRRRHSVVVFKDNGWKRDAYNGSMNVFPDIAVRSMEVIGNTHDNSDLLK